MLLKPLSSFWPFFFFNETSYDQIHAKYEANVTTKPIASVPEPNIKSSKREILLLEKSNINLRAGCWRTSVTIVSSILSVEPLLLKIIICSWRCNIQTGYRHFYVMWTDFRIIYLDSFQPQIVLSYSHCDRHYVWIFKTRVF